MKILTWNIAAGRKMQSQKQFSYQSESLEYFANRIMDTNSDVICLQEVHTNKTSSQTEYISKLLDFNYFQDCQCNTSHIDTKYKLGNSVISKYKFKSKCLELPYNSFSVYTNEDGVEEPAQKKFIQIAEFKKYNVANIHTSPLHNFGDSYEKGKGKILAQKIDEFLNKKLKKPLVFCGDFNFSNPQDIFPKTFDRLTLKEALPLGITRPGKENPDHIFISDSFSVIKSEIEKTESDHYLCWADLEQNK